MTNAALALLGQHAQEFATCYTLVVEALVRTGVPEGVARPEARAAALEMLFAGEHYDEDEEEGETCPLCGRKGG